MPDVNLIKDTEGIQSAPKKPVVSGGPELTDPSANTGAGFFGKFKSFLNRGPKPLPTTPAPVKTNELGTMTLKRNAGGNDRILSETKKPASSVIPLPEDDGATFGVNLLSEDLSPTIDPRRRAILLGVVAIGTIVFVGIVYGGLLYYKQTVVKKINTTESQLAEVKSVVAKLSADQTSAAVTVQKLAAVGSLIERHTRWTKFFSLLERYTLPSVTYGTSFTGDLNGTLALTATTDTYEQVAQQYLIFQQLVQKQVLISSFSIDSASASEKKDDKVNISFVVTMTVLPEVFTMTAEEAAQAANLITGVGSPSGTIAGPTGKALTDVLTVGPPSSAYTVTNGVQVLTRAYSDLEGALCHLLATPDDVQTLPIFARSVFQTALQSKPAPAFCTNASAAFLSAGVTALKTDADQDGVNFLFEELYNSSDATASTLSGQQDADAIQTLFLGTVTPIS